MTIYTHWCRACGVWFEPEDIKEGQTRCPNCTSTEEPHSIAEFVEVEREECAQIAESIDSGRGNEKEIAHGIREKATLFHEDKPPGWEMPDEC